MLSYFDFVVTTLQIHLACSEEALDATPSNCSDKDATYHPEESRHERRQETSSNKHMNVYLRSVYI